MYFKKRIFLAVLISALILTMTLTLGVSTGDYNLKRACYVRSREGLTAAECLLNFLPQPPNMKTLIYSHILISSYVPIMGHYEG